MSKKLDDSLLLKLKQKFTPLSKINMKFKGKDAVLKTDDAGDAVVLFIGQSLPNGKIKGDRYSRVLTKDKDGNIIKDHWDRKGKAD